MCQFQFCILGCQIKIQSLTSVNPKLACIRCHFYRYFCEVCIPWCTGCLKILSTYSHHKFPFKDTLSVTIHCISFRIQGISKILVPVLVIFHRCRCLRCHYYLNNSTVYISWCIVLQGVSKFLLPRGPTVTY